jgi:hypothetical protein
MKLFDVHRRVLLGSLLATTIFTIGCGREVKVPDLDQATAEQKRQEYEEMIKKERMQQK